MARSACLSRLTLQGLALTTPFLPLVVLVVIGVASVTVEGQAWAATSLTPAHATFYGGQDASGTMGGACGYGNLYSTGYGTATTALSGALFNNGLSCGACYLITCDGTQQPNCYAGKSITVTATNLCPQDSFGGWCDSPKWHFDLSYPVFTSLAPDVVGVIPVNYVRTPCVKVGGVRFQINGNPWFLLVLVYNVAGNGDVAALSVKGDTTNWFTLSHSWGQNWEGDNLNELVSQGLSLLVTLGSGASLVGSEVVPAGWSFGQTFESTNNF